MKGVVSRVTFEKVLKAFSLEPCVVPTQEAVVNSPGEALHIGASSVALRPPVPDISEITDRHTDTRTHTHTEYGY